MRIILTIASLCFGATIFVTPCSWAKDEQDPNQAKKYFESGNMIEAIEAWNHKLTQEPKDWRTLFNRAQAYLVLDQPQLALDDLEQLVLMPIGETAPQTYLLRGVALASLGRYENAIKDFERAWKTGKDPSALANKAMSLNSLGRTSDAYTLMEQLVQFDDSTANYYKLASLQKAKGNFESCIKTTTSIIQNNQKHAQAYALRGQCKEQDGQSSGALSDYLRSQSLAPNQPETMLSIGKILKKEGKTDEGVQWILKAASIYLIDHKPLEYKKALETAASNKGS